MVDWSEALNILGKDRCGLRIESAKCSFLPVRISRYKMFLNSPGADAFSESIASFTSYNT